MNKKKRNPLKEKTSKWVLPIAMLVVGVFLGAFVTAPVVKARADNSDSKGVKQMVLQILQDMQNSGGSSGINYWIAGTRAGDVRNTNTGRVGIGTAVPEANLDVNGDIRVGKTDDACGLANAGALKYVDNGGNSRDQLMVCKRGTDALEWGWYDIKDSGNS